MVTTAHEAGLPTTSTRVHGHVDTPDHGAGHLLLLRDLQRRTGGSAEPWRAAQHCRCCLRGPAWCPTPSGERLGEATREALSRLSVLAQLGG